MQLDRSAGQAKRRPDWADIKVGVMRELLIAKVTQNHDVRECLRATGTKRIVENSPVDDFWGCGPDGAGQNVVGELLMKIRSTLQ